MSIVFVAKRLPGSPAYTLRAWTNAYLGADRFGVLLCDSEAAGPQEEFLVHMVEEEGDYGFYLQSRMHQKFITISKPSDVSSESVLLRADAEDREAATRLFFKCHTDAKIQRRNKDKEKEGVIQQQYSQDEHGMAGSELLEQRIKKKGDKYC